MPAATVLVNDFPVLAPSVVGFGDALSVFVVCPYDAANIMKAWMINAGAAEQDISSWIQRLTTITFDFYRIQFTPRETGDYLLQVQQQNEGTIPAGTGYASIQVVKWIPRIDKNLSEIYTQRTSIDRLRNQFGRGGK